VATCLIHYVSWEFEYIFKKMSIDVDVTYFQSIRGQHLPIMFE
jgi:hypothetical protein